MTKDDAEITLVQKRTEGQRGPLDGECRSPLWYAEAEFDGWMRSGNGDTQEQASEDAKTKLVSDYNVSHKGMSA